MLLTKVDIVFAPSKNKIFIIQLFAWISIVIFYANANFYWILLSILFYILYAGVGVAMTFHRTLSHNSFKFPSITRKILIFIASMANVGSPLTWVAVHRAHHLYCDTKDDPHSPQVYPWYYVMFGTMFSKVPIKTVRDLLRDEYVLFIHQYYYLLQIPIILLYYLIGGYMMVFACHIIPGGLTWLAGSFVNYYNHKIGYQNHSTKDSSTNSYLTGFLVMGEGWHNNHHKYPIKASNKLKKHEFDLLYHVGIILGGKPKI